MGIVYAEITLVNPLDEAFAEHGYLNRKDIRAATVQAIVDTGAVSMVITEELRQKLGLTLQGDKIIRTANGQRVSSKITGAVEVRWKDRKWTVHALVLPGAEDVLLGAIPLEGLDLIVNPVTQELVGAHGDHEEYLVL